MTDDFMASRNPKNKVQAFLRHIELLSKESPERIVDGFYETEKYLVEKFITDTEYLIDHNEWGVGLENLLQNLYEINFLIDEKAVDLAKDAVNECNMDFAQYAFIETLVR